MSTSENDNIKPTLPEALRKMASDGTIRTHSENCWQWHLPCAAMRAADMIDDLQHENDRLNFEFAHYKGNKEEW